MRVVAALFSHTENIQTPVKSPDCLLGEITQLSDSRLSETRPRVVGYLVRVHWLTSHVAAQADVITHLAFTFHAVPGVSGYWDTPQEHVPCCCRLVVQDLVNSLASMDQFVYLLTCVVFRKGCDKTNLHCAS